MLKKWIKLLNFLTRQHSNKLCFIFASNKEFTVLSLIINNNIYYANLIFKETILFYYFIGLVHKSNELLVA